MSRPPVPAIERFNTKYTVDKSTGCWLWTACKFNSGYGGFSMPNPQRLLRAHRWSYEYHVGEIPDGMLVCHKCDTPSCVNPECLFIGTNQDNVDDMWSKGRGCTGGRRHKKLSEHSVRIIRRFFNRHPDTRGSGAFLARWFGVQKSTISVINTGKTWKDIT